MMVNYVKSVDRHTAVCILLILFVINSIGCSQVESKDGQNAQNQISNKETEGSSLVTKYMAHISKGEIQEADKLIAPKPSPEIKDDSNFTVNDGVSPNFPWSSVLFERNLILTKIINEKTEGENTKVDALLEVRKKPDINISATYYLEKRNGILLIKDIKLTPGKNN